MKEKLLDKADIKHLKYDCESDMYDIKTPHITLMKLKKENQKIMDVK